MSNKRFHFAGLIFLTLIQIFIPSKMIIDQERTLKYGKEFRFKTAPVDPVDPFRGRYVLLNFEDYKVPVSPGSVWIWGEEVYAEITTGADGFSGFSKISKIKPGKDVDFLKVKITSVPFSENYVYVSLLMDRFYMEEFKAPIAERIFNESVADSNSVTYGVLMVKNGEGVLKDVQIDGVSLVELTNP